MITTQDPRWKAAASNDDKAIHVELQKAVGYAKTFIQEAEKAMKAPVSSSILDDLEEAGNKIHDRIAYARRHLGW